MNPKIDHLAGRVIQEFSSEDLQLLRDLKKMLNRVSDFKKPAWVVIRNTRETGPVKEHLELKLSVEIVGSSTHD